MSCQKFVAREYHAEAKLPFESTQEQSSSSSSQSTTRNMFEHLGRQFKRQFNKGRIANQENDSYKSLKSASVPDQFPEQQQAANDIICPIMDSQRSINDVKSVLLREIKSNESNETYSRSRKQLLNDEDERRWDRSARLAASTNEMKAQRIVIKIREHDRINPNLFGNLPSEKIPAEESRDLGGRFLANKPRILESKVFQIARKMPKGAHLHEHFNSELMPEVLMPLIPRFVPENMFVRTSRPLMNASKSSGAKNDFDLAEIVFNVMPKDTATGDIFSPTYNPDFRDPAATPWMRWSDFQSEFNQRYPQGLETEDSDAPELSHLNNAEKWARERMVITRDRAYHSTQTHNGSWACFNQGTRAFKGLLNYESVYRWYIGAAMQNMIDDGIMYAELRPMLLDKSIPSDDGLRELNHKEQMTIICEEVAKKQKQLESVNMLRKFPFGVKIIYCTPRSIPRQKMESELADCLQLKLQFPDLICGFDLVGAEDRPNCISFYADLLVSFTETCRKLGISIPFMFHAGETLLDTGGSHDPSKSNLYDSLLLNAKRIGHGYALTRHPMLIEKYKEQNIALELCPISNELLHLCANVRGHPYPALLAAGLHCTLNSDNPSLFSTSPAHLTNEFYQVMVGDTRMSVHGWKQLAMWSIEHSCLSSRKRDHGNKESEQQEAMTIFKQDWEAWCEWVVREYGEYADSLPDLV